MLINYVYDVDIFKQMELNAALERAKEKWNGSSMHKSLPEMFRRSSRFAADHILIKLAMLYPELSGKEPRRLYDRAHSQQESGPWASDPEQAPNEEVEAKRTLVPFDELPAHQKVKDRLIVECIPKNLELRVL